MPDIGEDFSSFNEGYFQWSKFFHSALNKKELFATKHQTDDILKCQQGTVSENGLIQWLQGQNRTNGINSVYSTLPKWDSDIRRFDLSKSRPSVIMHTSKMELTNKTTLKQGNSLGSAEGIMLLAKAAHCPVLQSADTLGADTSKPIVFTCGEDHASLRPPVICRQTSSEDSDNAVDIVSVDGNDLEFVGRSGIDGNITTNKQCINDSHYQNEKVKEVDQVASEEVKLPNSSSLEDPPSYFPQRDEPNGKEFNKPHAGSPGQDEQKLDKTDYEWLQGILRYYLSSLPQSVPRKIKDVASIIHKKLKPVLLPSWSKCNIHSIIMSEVTLFIQDSVQGHDHDENGSNTPYELSMGEIRNEGSQSVKRQRPSIVCKSPLSNCLDDATNIPVLAKAEANMDKSNKSAVSYSCEFCNKTFLHEQGLKRHLLTHNGKRTFRCVHCSRSFYNDASFQRHLKSHTGEKPHQCSYCSMAFCKKSALEVHTRTHTGQRPYSCPYCQKRFSISGNLHRHLLIHTGLRPYKCAKCPKAFNNPSHLARHITSAHIRNTIIER